MMRMLWYAYRAWRGPKSRADRDWWPWYRIYLKSPQWRIRRRLVLWLHLGRCSVCGARATDVHHITYARVGHEDILNDLTAACRKCHTYLDRVHPLTGG